MKNVVRAMLRRLRISGGVVKLAAGGTGQSGEMYITADNKQLYVDGRESKGWESFK